MTVELVDLLTLRAKELTDLQAGTDGVDPWQTAQQLQTRLRPPLWPAQDGAYLAATHAWQQTLTQL